MFFPTLFGKAGYAGRSGGSCSSGYGGGFFNLSVSGTLQIDGQITSRSVRLEVVLEESFLLFSCKCKEKKRGATCIRKARRLVTPSPGFYLNSTSVRNNKVTVFNTVKETISSDVSYNVVQTAEFLLTSLLPASFLTAAKTRKPLKVVAVLEAVFSSMQVLLKAREPLTSMEVMADSHQVEVVAAV